MNGKSSGRVVIIDSCTFLRESAQVNDVRRANREPGALWRPDGRLDGVRAAHDKDQKNSRTEDCNFDSRGICFNRTLL